MTKKTNDGGKGKETSDRLSAIASRAVRGKPVSKADVKSLGGSVLSQDQTKGKRK